MKPSSITKLSVAALALAAAATFHPALADQAAPNQTQPAATATTNGALLVLNKAENALSIVDPATMKVLGRVTVGEGPHEVAASADGRTAYVGNYGTQQVIGSSISIIDITARKELKRVSLGALRRPHGLVEVGGKLYFTAEVNRAVARLDPATGLVDWLMGTGETATHMLVVSADGKKLYTANIASNTVTSINLGAPPSPQNITRIAVGQGPEGIAISPDGREVWVANRGDGSVSVIDTATNKVVATLPQVGKVPFRVAFTPDGKRVLIPDPESAELVVFDAASRKEIKRLKIEGVPVGITVAPDSRRAYVSLAATGGAGAIDLDKLELVASVQTGQNPDGIAFAPPAAKPAAPGGAGN
jgi:YVTN family beta-propeller protein